MNCLTQRNPVGYVSVDISTNVCICDRRSLGNCVFWCFWTWPAVRRESSSVSLERDFHHALPPAHVTSSIGTTFSGPKLSPLSHLGRWLLSTAADDHCALATVGSGKFGTGFGGVLTPSPLPTCSGAPEIAGTTITSLCSTVCLVTVCASPAAASARRPATGVHLMATTKLDSSRSDVGKRRIVRATTMPNIVPMRCVLLVRDRPNHKPYTHLLLNFAGWSVGSFHMTRSAEK